MHSPLATSHSCPIAIRTLIYTANAIGSLKRSLCKVIKTKAVFPNEDSVLKLTNLAIATSPCDRPAPSRIGRLHSHISLSYFPNRFTP